MRRAIVALTFATLFTTVAACGTPEPVICQAKADCEGGQETDVEVCEIQADANAGIADEKGCSDIYDSAMECYEENNACVAGTLEYSSDCDDLFTRLDACVGEVLDIGIASPMDPPTEDGAGM